MYDRVLNLKDTVHQKQMRQHAARHALFASKAKLKTGDDDWDRRASAHLDAPLPAQSTAQEAQARERRSGDGSESCTSYPDIDVDKIDVATHNFPADAAQISFLWIGQPRGVSFQ